MGYAVYEDRPALDYGVERWAGYGVPAICDFPECEAKIDRGMGFRCEEVTSYDYFDADGKPCTSDDEWEEERPREEEGCQMHFCIEHRYDHDKHKDIVPKPDTREWEAWMLADESWEEWRSENPGKVAEMQGRVGS